MDGSSKRSDVITRPALTFAVGRAPLRCTSCNALSGDPLAGLKITAYGSPPASLDWVTARTTDATGRRLRPRRPRQRRVFVLSATPYNGGTVYSDDIREAGAFDFKVGTVELTTVLHGATARPLPGHARRRRRKGGRRQLTVGEAGRHRRRGVIRFDLPGLGRGTTYVFEAASPSDGSAKRSQEITTLGQYLFRVGNAPLLGDPAERLQRRRRCPTSPSRPTSSWPTAEPRWATARHRRNGQAVFDLDGLGSGRTYVLSLNVYGTGSVDSEPTSPAPGRFDFRVGTLEVLRRSAAPPARRIPDRGHRLRGADRRQHEVDGRRLHRRRRRDPLRPARPGQRRTYVLEAKSPIDGSAKSAADITADGPHDFVVGKRRCASRWSTASAARRCRRQVSAYELLPDGTGRWSREPTPTTPAWRFRPRRPRERPDATSSTRPVQCRRRQQRPDRRAGRRAASASAPCP